jgi:hypothetical protein
MAILPILKKLKDEYHEFILKAVGRYVEKTREKHPDPLISSNTSVLTIPTYISCLRPNKNKTFEEYLLQIENQINAIRLSPKETWESSKIGGLVKLE